MISFGFLVALAGLFLLDTGAAEAQTDDTGEKKVLVFSKTAGFRHASIPDGIAAIKQLGQENGFAVDATEDAAQFNDQNLSQYDAVIWLSTTGDVLNAEQQAAFRRYIQNGGGYTGIHAAADTEYGWSWYGNLVGAYFDSHPSIQQATIKVEDKTHPSTSMLPDNWVRTDEWYNYRTNPRDKGIHVLATLDESSYSGGNMGADHPTAWCQNFDGGRSWYTGGGHTSASYSEDLFLQHMLGGIETAAGWKTANCGEARNAPPGDSDFQQVTLAKGGDTLGEPMALAVLPDRRVLSTARDGSVYLTTPDSKTTLAAQVPVYNHDEDGLQGVAIDPNFADNNWVYLYYAPPLDTPPGDAPNSADDPSAFEPYKGYNLLSRFKMVGDKLDLSTGQEILRVAADRGICCHAGGEIDFDAQGNLYLSTGDDTNPFQSDGYTPIDERPNRNPAFDAQRSSANTNDLRGKLLRVKVQPDGTYTIPEGNLFPETQDANDKTRPEIYAMGFRNPFRFAVDKATGDVLLGDYGPDAGSANPDRGPGGMVEFNLIKEAGNYGWPYCVGDNVPYNDYDFATGQSGAKFDCSAPVNESPRNDGLTQLPAVEPAWIHYDGCTVTYGGKSTSEFGCGSESPMGGPTYNFDPNLDADFKFPEYYDGKKFLYEWGRGWIKTITEEADGSPGTIEPFFDSMDLVRPMSVEFGPKGSLYVLDYGGGFFSGDANSALYRIDYVQGQRAPIAETSADPNSGPAPLTVQFSSEGSRDLDAGDSITSYEWDFQDDGTVDSTEPNPTFTYQQNGDYTARLTVTDTTGRTGTATESITVGNTRPEVNIEVPPNGGLFGFGDQIEYTVTVTDPEDGQIDCSKVEVISALGHNEHSHQDQNFTGCEGTFTVPARWEDDSEYIFYIINATYTDSGGPTGAAALTGEDQVILQPKHLQAEHYSSQEGTQTVDNGGAEGGTRVGYTDNGDYIAFEPFNLTNINSVSLRGSSGGSGGTVEFRWNAPDGQLLGSVDIPNTGGWSNYDTFGPIQLQNVPEGDGTLYLVFSGGFDVDSMTFQGKGVASNGPPTIESASASPKQGEAPLEVNFSSNATDPEGGEVTYEWDFGVPNTEADTANTQNATYTYTEPGTYTATLTATDPQGLSSKRNFKINVSAPTPPCPTPGSDTFDGTELDKSLWSVVREDTSNYSVSDGALTIQTTNTDMYGGNTSGKNLILQPAPAGAWTATTKVSLDAQQQYQQAGLMVYGNDQNFAKLDLLNVGGGRKVEFIRQTDGQPRNQAEDSTAVPADFPDTFYLRIMSNGENLTAYYSADGQNWQQAGRAAPLAGITDPRVGVFALNGVEAPSIPATFEYFNLVTPSDEFNGDALTECRWTKIVRENESGYSVANGSLNIDTGNGTDMYGGNTNAENIILQPAPNGGWEATTKVTLDFSGKNYEQASLMVYGNDQNFAKLSYIKVPDGRNLEFILQQDGQPVDGGAQDRTPLLAADVPSTLYLKITSDGTNLRASWSEDGQNWNDFGRARPLSAIPDPHIGLAAFNGNGSGNAASFDWFRLGESTQVSANAAADPKQGEAPLDVNFTGTATDPKGEQLTYAWDFTSDGTVDAETKDANHTYTEPSTYTATFTATTADGRKASDTVEVRVFAPCTNPSQPEDGYTALFDGTDQSLQDWKMAGPGSFERNGCTIKSVGGLGLYWYDQEFTAPYSLKLEWMKPGDDNSGVFVGFPNPGNDPWVAVNQGEEIQIDSTDVPEKTTGAIYNEQSADIAARDAALNSDGEWNEYEIRVTDTKIIVYLNGTKINEWTDDDPNVDLSQGYIGLQNHGGGDDVFFRNVRIKETSGEKDTTAPTVSSELDPAQPDGNNGWYTQPVTVSLSADDGDGSGVESIEWQFGHAEHDNHWHEGESKTYTGPITIEKDGSYTLLYRATDKAGNTSEVKSVSIKIDTKTPVTTAELDPPEPNGDPTPGYEGTYNTPVEVTLTAKDATSGVAGTQYRLDDGEWSVYTEPIKVSEEGKHVVAYRSVDKAGNVEEAGTVSFEIKNDACPGSDLRNKVWVGEQHTNVDNIDTGDGCTINDLIKEEKDWKNHGQFMGHVNKITKQLVADDIITKKEREEILEAAGKSDVGKKEKGKDKKNESKG